MTNERYEEIFNNDHINPTPEERSLGWHFCTELDNLLVGPGMDELAHCSCNILESAHPARDEAEKRNSEEIEAVHGGMEL